MSTMNYYVVLGIAQDADGDTIRSAFRALARRYHPDAGPGSSRVEFQRAVEAYETLSDPGRRRAYDRLLRASRVRPTTTVQPFPVSRPVVQARFDLRTIPLGVRSTLVLVTRSVGWFGSPADDWFW